MYVFLYQRNQVVGAIDCCIWVKICYEKPVADIEYNEAGREDNSGKKESWHQSINQTVYQVDNLSQSYLIQSCRVCNINRKLFQEI